jgi:hypothetical protein
MVNLARATKQIEKFAADNSPSILTAFGVAGTVTTAYLTGKAAFKAREVLLDLQYGPNLDYDSEYDILLEDQIKEPWKLYIPAAISGIGTVACIIGANRIGNRRAAAMAAAYSLSERAYAEYKDKVVQAMGVKKEQVVRDEIAQTRVAENPVNKQNVIITGNGEVLCYDAYTGRYFNSSVDMINKAQNAINHQILSDGYASLGDFYSIIGLDATSITNEVGWNADKLLEITFSTVLSDDDRPCVSINFSVMPVRDYYKFY